MEIKKVDSTGEAAARLLNELKLDIGTTFKINYDTENIFSVSVFNQKKELLLKRKFQFNNSVQRREIK